MITMLNTWACFEDTIFELNLLQIFCGIPTNLQTWRIYVTWEPQVLFA